MSNTITIELCKEDRQRIDDVTALLACIYSEMKSQNAPVVMTAGQVQKATAPTTAEKPEPVPEFPLVDDETPFDTPAPAAAPEPDKEPEAPKITLDEIQALVVKLAAPESGKRAQVRAIVKEYAERVGLIPTDKFPEVMERLTALAKEG